MWLDNASDIDILFFKPYASIISNIVKEKDNNPLTIGVFGLWGAGKSTLLKLIQNELPNDDSKILCIQINAWMFEGYEDAKTALMEALLKELEHKKPFEGIKKKVRDLITRVDFFKLGTSLLSTSAPVIASIATGNPLPLALNISSDSTKISEQISSIAKSIQEYKTQNVTESIVDNVRKFKQEFEELLEGANVDNVVVLLDDLDRCSPERIVESLEAIKLFLSVKRTTFIIAADEDVIQYAIKKKYPQIEGSDVELSKEYIEKIIQLPIYIPELSSKDIENYLLLLVAQNYLTINHFQTLIDKIYEEKLIIRDNRITLQEIKSLVSELSIEFTPTEAEFLEDTTIIDSIRDIVSTTLKGNPRQAKRFMNTFVTKKSLAQMYYGNDVDMRILAKLLVLQKLDPDLFNQLNDWNKEFTLCNDKFKEMYYSVMSDTENVDYIKWAMPSIKKWLECEPKDLYNQRLDRYFYLTRENLTQNIINPQNFSTQARHVLDLLVSVKEGTISGVIDTMKKLPPVDIDNVFSVLLTRIKNDQLAFFIIKELFKEFTSYQDRILDAIENSHQNIVLADTIYLTAMYSINIKKVKPVLDRMKDVRLDTKLYDRIIGGKK